MESDTRGYAEIFFKYLSPPRTKPLLNGFMNMVRGAVSYRAPVLIMIIGDVVYLQVFRQPIVVLNSLEAAQDLLDKRSHIYSDRPNFVLLNEL